MTAIRKTEAIVLSKLKYGDTSKIAILFTKDLGKLSFIIKGGRQEKSTLGKVIEPFNYVQIVFYDKQNRELQLITQSDLLLYFHNLQEDFEKLKYASAILELFMKLLPEEEPNLRLFKGLLKILGLIDKSQAYESVDLFNKFILFFVKEIGYEINLDNCSNCNKQLNFEKNLVFDFENGLLCNDCRYKYPTTVIISAELFQYFLSLKTNSKSTSTLSLKKEASVFFEKMLKYHFSDFKGINSLKL